MSLYSQAQDLLILFLILTSFLTVEKPLDFFNRSIIEIIGGVFLITNLGGGGWPKLGFIFTSFQNNVFFLYVDPKCMFGDARRNGHTVQTNIDFLKTFF